MHRPVKMQGQVNAAALLAFWHGGTLAFLPARLRGGPLPGPPLGLAPVGAAAAAHAARRCSGPKRPPYDGGPFWPLGPPPPCGRGRRSSPGPLLLSQPSRGPGWPPACAAAHSGLRGASAAALAFLKPRAPASRASPFLPFGVLPARGVSACARGVKAGRGARHGVGRCGGRPPRKGDPPLCPVGLSSVARRQGSTGGGKALPAAARSHLATLAGSCSAAALRRAGPGPPLTLPCCLCAAQQGRKGYNHVQHTHRRHCRRVS